MGMLTNGPARECSIPGPHQGLLHEFDIRMIARLDGTAVKDAPVEKTYLCQAHAPHDDDDPKYLLCACALCKERTGRN